MGKLQLARLRSERARLLARKNAKRSRSCSAHRKMPRLGQWDGRRHSLTARRTALLRLAEAPTVLIAARGCLFHDLLVTLLAFWWGAAVALSRGEIWRTTSGAHRIDVGGHRTTRNDHGSRLPEGHLLVAHGPTHSQRRQLDLLRARRPCRTPAKCSHEDLSARATLCAELFSSSRCWPARSSSTSPAFRPSLAHNLPMIAGVCVLILLHRDAGPGPQPPPRGTPCSCR